MNYSLIQCSKDSELEIAQFDTFARAYNYLSTMLFSERAVITKSVISNGAMYSSSNSETYYRICELPSKKEYFVDGLA